MAEPIAGALYPDALHPYAVMPAVDTVTSTISPSPTASETLTETPSPTVSATPSATLLPSSTSTPSPLPMPVCSLSLAPLPAAIEQGGSEDLQIAAQPNAVVSLVVQSGASFPVAAALFGSAAFNAGTPITSTAVAGGREFQFTLGFGGTALLSFPIPTDASPVQAPVSATATCPDSTQASAQTAFSIVAEQPIPFTGHLRLSTHSLFIRSVNPVGGGVHLGVGVTANAQDLLTLSATVSAKSASSLGSVADGGTAYANGAVISTAAGTADSAGTGQFSLPVPAALLVPGQGAVVKLTITAAGSGGVAVYRTSVPVRENRLRLVVEPKATTRGGQRALLHIARRAGGTTSFSVLAVADPGAHLSGTLSLGATLLHASGQAGPGGRVTLHFSVQNSAAPAHGNQAVGALTMTSAFRGASITRGVGVLYGAA